MNLKSLQKTASDIAQIITKEVEEMGYKVLQEQKALSKDEAGKLKLYSDILSVSFQREKDMGAVDWTTDVPTEELEDIFETK